MLAPPPPLTNASTASEESAEEFPLQESYETGSAILTKAEYTPQPSIKIVRTKLFSLRAITRPFSKTSRSSKVKASAIPRGDTELKSAQKSSESSKKAQRRFRVSFSPSTEDDYVAEKTRVRRASFSDSIGKSQQHPLRKRALSISWSQQGVHVAAAKASQPPHRWQSQEKGRPLKPRTTKQQVVAAKNAANHARALEQIINAGSSLNIDSIEILKAKREMRTGGKLDKTKVQMIPAVSPHKVKALGAALLDSTTANDIIGELRSMQLSQRDIAQEQGTASELLKKLQKRATELDQVKQVSPQPIRAVFLDCLEEEIDARQLQSAVDTEKQVPAVDETAATISCVTNLWGWTGWIRPQEKAVVALAVEAPVSSPAISSTNGVLSGISPISFVLSPATPSTAVAATPASTYDMIGALSGIAVRAANGGEEEMQAVHPPLDRLAILVHWWGFELTIPKPSMIYLARAQNISSSLMGILQTIAISGGVPEILPFVRYFSTFVDMEFGAIKSQDHGNGVVVAATWLMPMALVPRPWDYPSGPIKSTRPPLLSSSPLLI